MKVREYLALHPEINRDEFFRKLAFQYTNPTEEMDLTNYMVWMDKPFWWIEHVYDISYNRKSVVGDHGDDEVTTFEFMVDTKYDEAEAEWLTSEEAETWFKGLKNRTW